MYPNIVNDLYRSYGSMKAIAKS